MRRRRPAVSEAALGLLGASEVVDLHVDTFIATRLFGYDPRRRHGLGPTRGRFTGHLDFPRMAEGGLTGALLSITTNPLRRAPGRLAAWDRNVRRLGGLVEGAAGLVWVDSLSAYREARAKGTLGAFLAIQGGNALAAVPAEALPEALSASPGPIAVTLTHLTPSGVGGTSSPLQRLGGADGLRPGGWHLLEALVSTRIFVDLAHAGLRTFWDAVAAHPAGRPLLVSHTGVDGVRPHWRNLDDDQIRAVAASGGVVGVIFETAFLRPRGAPRDAHLVARHLEHLIQVGGEGVAALGSDFDGAIRPPPDLRDGATAYARLVQVMLERRWSEPRIRRVLGGNFLRALGDLRP